MFFFLHVIDVIGLIYAVDSGAKIQIVEITKAVDGRSLNEENEHLRL